MNTNLAPQQIVNDDVEYLTREQFERCLPPNARKNLTDKMLDQINQVLESTPEREAYKENLLSFTSILKDSRFSLPGYIRAVRYASLKLGGDSNIVAYAKTFPERYQKMVKNGWAEKDINSQVSTWNKSQMVAKIFEQSLIPHWILNQQYYQMALNTQVELMTQAKSEKVRSDAANSILTHLKMPETAKIELDVNLKEDDSITELRKVTMELAQMQRKQIQAGALSAQDVALQKIVREEKVISEQ